MTDTTGGSSNFDDSAATSEGRMAGENADGPASEGELTDRGGRETDPSTGAAISTDDPGATGAEPDLDAETDDDARTDEGAPITGDADADKDARGIDGAGEHAFTGGGERDIDESALTEPDNASGSTPREWP